ncbi:MAG TPA: chromate transporter [Ideonella sp.]|jgi:chromate transporter|nr:chromate transporter [Ideonella sp.]
MNEKDAVAPLPPAPAAATTAPAYTMWQLVAYMLGLGTWGFGGPVALVGYMYRDLVEKRRWLTEADYKEGMAIAQLMPGPLAAQLAIYLGYVHYHVLGATLVGLAFVIPSFIMVVAIGMAYVTYGGIGWMQSVFYGVGAAVIGIIAMSAHKLTTKNIGKDKLLWAIFAVSAAITIATQSEEIWLFLGAGVLVWLWRVPPAWLKRGGANAVSAPLIAMFALDAVDPAKLAKIATYFAYAGSFVFGSGLAIVPFLYSGVVKEYGWLTDRQFVDAVAVAMITPGPVVITTGFIGFLVSGFWGAVVAAIATFLPCYLLTVIPAPYFKKHGKRPAIVAFVDGVTAAAIGAIAGAVIVIGQRSITDWITAALAIVTALVLWRFKKVQEPVIVLVAALIGLVVHPLVVHA